MSDPFKREPLIADETIPEFQEGMAEAEDYFAELAAEALRETDRRGVGTRDVSE